MPSLQFKGKALVQNHHLVVPFSELEAVKSRGVSKSPSLDDNLIIEGDNLKALKALLPAFHGKIKCIYIDPPYNTGNEGWIYNDKVNSPMIRDWLGKTVDRDDLTRHDKWCCMMLPRLKMLRELLSDDGAIFVSIDDNEMYRMRALMDEVFGERNWLATIANVSNPKGRSDDKYVASAHEYVIIYKASEKSEFKGWEPGENILRRYNKTDIDGVKYREIDLRKTGDNDRREDRRNLFYYFHYNSTTNDLYATDKEKCPEGYISIKPLRADGKEGNWRWEVSSANSNIEKLIPKIMPTRGTWGIFEKDVLTEDKRVKPTSVWNHKEVNSERGSEQFIELGFDKEVFPRPKPIGLLRLILAMITATDNNDIILDATAGSGTTAQAVLGLNEEDGGNRRFILCQMPYETKEQETNKQNICDTVTAERVRRVIKGVPKAKDENLRKGLSGTFSYFTLGKELQKQAILDGTDLPSYDALAGYVFFTASGDVFLPKKMKRKNWFIGTSHGRDVFLIYEEDIEKLKDMALNLELARSIANFSDRPKLVFAPTKYLDQDYLDHLRIEFCQLPFEIYQHASK